MKTKIILSAAAACFVSAQLIGQSFNWAKTYGGSKAQLSENICTDATGNVYTVGEFSSSVNFDPATSTNTVISNGSYDLYLTKHSNTGSLIWYKTIGSANPELATCVRMDPSGDIYFMGTFDQKTDFDPSSSVDTLNSAGKFGAFISKYDANGNYLNTKLFQNIQVISDMVFEPNGNILIVGYTHGIDVPDVDFSAATYSIGVPNNTQQGVVIRYNSSWGFLNAFKIGGGGFNVPQDVMYIYDIVLESNGMVICGGFRGDCDFDPGVPNTNNATSPNTNSNYDMYFAKYDLSGNLLWHRVFASANGDYASSVEIYNNKLYVTGRFEGTIDMDPSAATATITSNGGIDVFFGCYDLSGNLVWVKSFGSPGDEYSARISMGQGNNSLIVSGTSYNATLDIDPGAAVVTVSTTGNTSLFVGVYDLNGNYLNHVNISGTNNSYLTAHEFKNNGIYLTGYYRGTANFDPNASSYSVVTTGVDDAFVCKYSMLSTALSDYKVEEALQLFPNPTSHEVQLVASVEIDRIEVVNSVGEIVLLESTLNIKETRLEVSSLKQGVYFVKLYTKAGLVTKKLIKN